MECELGKYELLANLAMLPEADEKWQLVERAVRGYQAGMDRDEKMMTLAAVAAEVGLDRTWLYRLGIRQRCGRQIAGKPRYRPSEVRKWLESPECAAASKELSRKRREQRVRSTVTA